MKNSPETLEKRNAKRAHWKKTTDESSFPKYILKVCKKCKLEKLCKWNSSFTQTGIPEYKNKCNDCHQEYNNSRRKIRRKIVTEQTLQRKYKIKRKCIEYLGGRCDHCGYDRCDKALTFHHMNPNDKLTDVCKILDHRWDKLKTELDKCKLLCFNCHMEEEARLYEYKRDSNKTHE